MCVTEIHGKLAPGERTIRLSGLQWSKHVRAQCNGKRTPSFWSTVPVPSVSCLFTLLILFFDAQNLKIFMKSSLSILLLPVFGVVFKKSLLNPVS